MKSIILSVIIFCSALSMAHGQSLTEKIALDKNVVYGKLANGLTYYIRKNAKPENKAEMRLVVNAGSVLERNDQQGVAHFLEHMAFNGTKNFPKDQLLNYLQRSGVRFGADLNATTSFDFTMYMLPIPSNDETILANGFKILRDWAGNLLLDPAEIEKERGVIIEEKRMRQNAGQRTFAQYLPALTNNSKYGERIPIGKEEIIKTSPRKAFTDFYRDWYRPNNMAVIVVGDIDIAAAEKKIKTLFADLKNPANAPKRPEIIPISWHTATKSKIVSDAENTNNLLQVYFDVKRNTNNGTWAAYKEQLTDDIIEQLYNTRVGENFVNPTSPVSFGSLSLNGSLLKGYSSSSIVALVKNSPADALKMMIGEILKCKQYGFTANELELVKKNLLKRYSEGLAEKNKTESAAYTDEYVNHFLNNEPSPGIEAEYAFVESLLKSITITEINNRLKGFNIDGPAFILYNCTENNRKAISEDSLLITYNAAKQQKVEAYVEKKVSGELMDKAPVPGKIIKTESNAEAGIKTYYLSNGIKVAYKKTDFKNDEIVFKAAQWGGSTVLKTEETKTAKYLFLVNNLGLGKHTAVEMPKVMNGVLANAAVNLLPTSFVVNGNGSAKDFEKLLQVIYLKLTQPNFNEQEFEGIKANVGSQLANLLKNPQFRFQDTLTKFRYNNSKRVSGLPLQDEIMNLKVEDIRALYKKLTSNFNGMVVTFAGNIDETGFESLIEKYIGSLPATESAVTLNNENILKSITGKTSLVTKGGKENKSEINLSYYGVTKDMNDKDVLSFLLLGEILQMQANQKLREEMGSTYSPRVATSITRPPVGDYSIALIVSSLPENVDKLTAAFDEMIQKIISGTLSDDDLVKAKAQRIKTMDNSTKTNPYWAGMIEQMLNFNLSADNAVNYKNLTEAITKQDIINAAVKFLKNANSIKGVMNPE